MGGEVESLPADKHKSFLPDGSITLGVISQTDPKYQKQSVYSLCNISRKTWRMMLQVFSNWYYHFRCIWPGMSKLPKITSLLFLYSTMHESLLQTDTNIFDGYGQTFLKFPKKQVCNVFTISLKKSEMKLTFLMQIKIKVS